MNIPDSSKGFTLIELILVIIVLGILSAVIIPRFWDGSSSAYQAAIESAVGSVRSAATIFKSNMIVKGIPIEQQVTLDGITGSRGQPFAASMNPSVSMGYTQPPEIFKAAGLVADDWSYRIFVDNTYQVIATPKGKLNQAQPSQAAVLATNCYFHYIWSDVDYSPVIVVEYSGC
jgi:MSHA pilin protein MshA